MSKKIVLLLALLMTVSSSTVLAKSVDKLQPVDEKKDSAPKAPGVGIMDTNTVFYPNATVKSAIAKYKAKNYTGCLQELYSVVKKDPSNALAYYYMAMSYTYLNMESQAVEAYEKVMALSSDKYLSEFAEKGRDCLTGGPACINEQVAAEQLDELDKFINSPYGDGLSPEMQNVLKEKQLKSIKDTINKKDTLENDDIKKIKDFDEKNKSMNEEETIKIAQVSDEDVLQAINTLKDAGLTINVQSSENPYVQMSQYQDPKMAEMSMLLGNYNNNNNNNSMMSMLPLLMTKAEKGENIDPRLMQTMMMNSMLTDFNFNTNNNNRY